LKSVVRSVNQCAAERHHQHALGLGRPKINEARARVEERVGGVRREERVWRRRA
jgi:hypothetical protein